MENEKPNLHPGLTPEHWLALQHLDPSVRYLWCDMFARLHRLEEASKPTPVMPHAERPEPAPAQPHPPTSSPCDIPGMCAKMNRKCDDCDPLTHADRPEWWHRLNAASPEIAARAARAISEQKDAEWDKYLSGAFVFRDTPEKHQFWLEVDAYLNGKRPDLPPLPVDDAPAPLESEELSRRKWAQSAADELTRLRAEVERLTKERDEAREQGRQEGHKEAREGIAEVMLRRFHESRALASDQATGRAYAYRNAADIALIWQPAQEGGAK